MDFNDEGHNAVSAEGPPTLALSTHYGCYFESVLIGVDSGQSALGRKNLEVDVSVNPGAVQSGLPLFQGAHDLETLGGCIGFFEGFETTDCSDHLLEFAVIGLDHIVQVFHLSVPRCARQLAFLFQLFDRHTVSRGFVRIDRLGLLPILQSVRSRLCPKRAWLPWRSGSVTGRDRSYYRPYRPSDRDTSISLWP